jgi:SAM-dependent methyltransferase
VDVASRPQIPSGSGIGVDMKLPHQQTDIAAEGFQRLEDLATSSWYAEVLFAALDLNIFGLLGEGPASVAELVEKSAFEADALTRFLASLAALGLITEHQGKFDNGPLAARYLIPGQNGYLGDFLLYRRYLASHWPRLAARIRQGMRANDRPLAEPPEAYQERTLAYVRAMDLQARLKAAEALKYLGRCLPEPRRVLDLGGGAGAWCRAFRRQWPRVHAVLLDLPETLDAAWRLYPDPSDWEGIEALAGNGLASCLKSQAFDLILLSNVLHAYGESEAGEILSHCVDYLAPGGMVLIHDYLADLHGSDPVKGSLYDLHMLVNTYNGRIYRLAELEALLLAAGLKNIRLFHLASDTSILLAGPEESQGSGFIGKAEMLAARAGELGFSFARIIKTSEVVVEPWVRLKCRFGCSRYGQSLGCPPSRRMKRRCGRFSPATSRRSWFRVVRPQSLFTSNSWPWSGLSSWRATPRPWLLEPVPARFVPPARKMAAAVSQKRRGLPLKGMGITFGMETRANDITPAIMRTLVDAGLTSVLIGLESGSPHILQRLGKHTSTTQNEQAIAMVREAGLEPEIGFIMFDAASTLDDLAQNLNFLQRTGLLTQLGRTANLLYHDHIAFKGTPGYKESWARGRLAPQGLFGFEGRLLYEDDRVGWLAGLMKSLCQFVLKEMGDPQSPLYWRLEDVGTEPHQTVNDHLVETFIRLLRMAGTLTARPEAAITERLLQKTVEELQSTISQGQRQGRKEYGDAKKTCWRK